MSCGGVGNEKVADETVKELIAGLKASVEEKAGSSFETFEAVSYATQVSFSLKRLLKFCRLLLVPTTS